VSAPLSLLEALADIPDPRNCQGVCHPLSAILALAVLAMLTGARGYSAIAQFGRDKSFPLAWAPLQTLSCAPTSGGDRPGLAPSIWG
jgi:hypothetical protein